MPGLLISLKRQIHRYSHRMHQRLLQWTSPTARSVLEGALTDLARTKDDLIAKNALLRQQLIILHRQVKHQACTRTDRILLVLLARAARHWKQALLIVQPDTLVFRKSEGAYAWLKAHDKTWLDANLPPCKAPPSIMWPGSQKKSTSRKGHHMTQKEREERDRDLTERVKKRAQALINAPSPPQRVTLRKPQRD
ncbi:MAG TPA: hypothetical protein VFV38_43305 [Ktedonobacteraceae bacterium]|nr:hypothetical protein [Ktedonobacteraceae bacterium]